MYLNRLKAIGTYLLRAIIMVIDFIDVKILQKLKATYRMLWVMVTYKFRANALYFNPPTNEVIQIVKFDTDSHYSGELLIVFNVVRPGRVNRTQTVYDWDDFLTDFHRMRPLTSNEELLYGIR